MATTTFSGPVKAGTIREGASANTGFVLITVVATYNQSGSAATAGAATATVLYLQNNNLS
jgi:hypothetical protein